MAIHRRLDLMGPDRDVQQSQHFPTYSMEVEMPEKIMKRLWCTQRLCCPKVEPLGLMSLGQETALSNKNGPPSRRFREENAIPFLK